MVKISDSKPKSSQGFFRIFGNAEIGTLFSKVQSAIIRSGFELEEIISREIPAEIHTSLDELATTQPRAQKRPLQVVVKPSRPDPDNTGKSIQADFLIVNNTDRLFTLVEIKEGYVFDTKKSDGELASLKSITSWLAQEFPYRAEYYLCSFNQDDKQAIMQGTKGRFTIEHVMTGYEFCERVGLDYDYILGIRKSDQQENLRYLLSELIKIPDVKAQLIDLIDELESLDD